MNTYIGGAGYAGNGGKGVFAEVVTAYRSGKRISPTESCAEYHVKEHRHREAMDQHCHEKADGLDKAEDSYGDVNRDPVPDVAAD